MRRNEKLEEPARRLCALECEEFVWLLTEYWETDEDTGLRDEIEEHARTCPHCSVVYDEYLHTVQACRCAPRVCTPEDVHRRFWNQLTREIEALKDYLG